MEMKVTFDLLPVAGAVLSVLMFLVAGFSKKFEALPPEKKQLINTGILFLCCVGAVALSAAGFIAVYHGPTWREWVWYPAVDFVAALLANVGVYKSFNYLAKPKK